MEHFVDGCSQYSPDESNSAWFAAHFIFQNILLNDVAVFAENRLDLVFVNGPWQICHIQICIFDILAGWSRKWNLYHFNEKKAKTKTSFALVLKMYRMEDRYLLSHEA